MTPLAVGRGVRASSAPMTQKLAVLSSARAICRPSYARRSPTEWPGSWRACAKRGTAAKAGNAMSGLPHWQLAPTLILLGGITAVQTGGASGDRTRDLRIKSTVIRFSGPPACADAAASTSDRAQFAGVPASPLAGSLAATSRPAARAKISGPVARSMPTGTRVPEGEPGIVPNSRDDAAEHHGPGRCRGDCRWTSSLRLVHGPGRKVMVAGGKPRGQYEDDGASGQARSY